MKNQQARQNAQELPPALATLPSDQASSEPGDAGADNFEAGAEVGTLDEALNIEMVENEPEEELPSSHGREVDELELAALLWRRFAGIGPSEMVELAATTSKGLRVAYAKGENEYLRLLREGEQLPGVTGVYQVANLLTSRVRQLCRTGHWVATSRRASDAWIASRRVLPVDIDSVRPVGQSATDAEKEPCFEAADRIEQLLREHVDPSSIARGDSGNGLWLFIALEQLRCSDADDAQIAKLLKHLQKSFSSAHVKVDSTVANPSRLVPCWGTMKQKGHATAERPHRRTTFTCWGQVRRVQLAELFE